MNTLSVALGSSFSSILSLLTLDTRGPLGFGLSKEVPSTDTFVLWGTLDSAATDATNAQNLGTFTGGSGIVLPPGVAQEAATWPYLLVQRTAGSTAGNFYVTGNPQTSTPAVSTAAPSGTAFSSVLNLTSLNAESVRIGGGRTLTADDVFDVYVSQDSTVSSAAGCVHVGQISGGNSNNGRQIAVLTAGYPYAIIQREGGSTTGSIIAAGVAPPSVPSSTTDTRNERWAPIDTQTSYGTVNELSGVPVAIAVSGPCTPSVRFPAGWGGGTIRASALSRDGTPATALLAYPGVAGWVDSPTVFIGPISYQVLVPGGSGAHNAELGVGPRVCAGSAPVTAIVLVMDVVLNAALTMGTVDLTNGWVEITPAPTTLQIPYIYYVV